MDEIRFIIVGDPHITIDDRFGSNARLQEIVDFANNSTIDFVATIGDNTEANLDDEYLKLKEIISKSNKPFLLTIGNHDGAGHYEKFELYIGPAERIEHIKGYQLLFIGLHYISGKIGWSFDFNNTNIDKNAPTIVFIHGPLFRSVHLINPIQEADWTYPRFNPYDIMIELNKFTHLLGVFSGHTHESNYFDYGTKYAILRDIKNEGASTYSIPFYTNHVGYVKADSNEARFTQLDFEKQFVDPFPLSEQQPYQLSSLLVGVGLGAIGTELYHRIKK